MAEGGAAPPPAAMRGGISTAIFAIVVVVVAILAFVGGLGVGGFFVPPPGEEPPPPPPPPMRPAVLAIATNTPFPPFEFLDANGNIVGFDIDLITEIMSVNRLNLSFEFVDFRDFSALLAAVQSGIVEVAASAITSSGATGAERNMTMDFSDPYYEADQAVLAQVGQDPTMCDPSGCTPANFANISIATQSGTTSQFWVECEVPNFMLTTFADVTLVLQTLQAGAVQVVIIDKPAGEAIAAANPAIDLVGTIETNELYAFAVPDGDPLGLIPDINQALAAIIADGTYATIQAKWF